MRRNPFFLVLASLLTLSACGSRKQPDAPGPRPINVPDSNECQNMCDHLKQLGCEEGQPVYNSDLPGTVGVPNQDCPDWCEEIQILGTFLNPRCLKNVPSCGLIEEWRKKTCTD